MTGQRLDHPLSLAGIKTPDLAVGQHKNAVVTAPRGDGYAASAAPDVDVEAGAERWNGEDQA
jgi:hypothetical protein